MAHVTPPTCASLQRDLGISDCTGRKRAFLIGLPGFAAASALGGAADTFEMLLANAIGLLRVERRPRI
ncbi:hypothetical protein [Streptomyces venezuelae]|uniref:hypothetical protein n=1 Tax=Streptomyces venezuelae TaxID=54571 RepID=UPI0037B197C6